MGESTILKKRSLKKAEQEPESFFIESDEEEHDEVEVVTALIPPYQQSTQAPDTFTPQEIQQLIPAVTKKQKTLVHEIRGSLAGKEMYTIELFNAKSLVQRITEMGEAHKAFHDCASFTEADRVKVLFALTDQIRSQNQVKIKRDAYGLPALEYNDAAIDSSVIDRLNINHLFTRAVDRYLHACGS